MLRSSEPACLQPKEKGAPGTVSGFQPSRGIVSTAGAELPQEDEGAMESETGIRLICDPSIGPTAPATNCVGLRLTSLNLRRATLNVDPQAYLPEIC